MYAVRGSLREERGELCSHGPAPLELWQTTAFNELTFQHIAATETDMNRQCDQQRVLGAFKKLSAVLKKLITAVSGHRLNRRVDPPYPVSVLSTSTKHSIRLACLHCNLF